MTRIVLGLIGAMYVVLGIWCAVQPQTTSRTVGFELTAGTGQSEFLTVYGGLEMGLGLGFLVPLLRKEMQQPILIVCLLVHLGIVACRTLGYFLFPGISDTTRVFAGVEWGILIVCAWRVLAGSRSARLT